VKILKIVQNHEVLPLKSDFQTQNYDSICKNFNEESAHTKFINMDYYLLRASSIVQEVKY
jgi:hypothetical protein